MEGRYEILWQYRIHLWDEQSSCRIQLEDLVSVSAFEQMSLLVRAIWPTGNQTNLLVILNHMGKQLANSGRHIQGAKLLFDGTIITCAL